jgi:hypothetical protein
MLISKFKNLQFTLMKFQKLAMLPNVNLAIKLDGFHLTCASRDRLGLNLSVLPSSTPTRLSWPFFFFFVTLWTERERKSREKEMGTSLLAAETPLSPF